MSAFPKLKTGAVAQYPAGRAISFGTEVFRFLDGSEQRYRAAGALSRRWVIRLDLLDAAETARIQEFFASVQGRFGSFSFEDPWNGTTYPDCSLESDELAIEELAEGRGRVAVIVRENRT